MVRAVIARMVVSSHCRRIFHRVPRQPERRQHFFKPTFVSPAFLIGLLLQGHAETGADCLGGVMGAWLSAPATGDEGWIVSRD